MNKFPVEISYEGVKYSFTVQRQAPDAFTLSINGQVKLNTRLAGVAFFGPFFLVVYVRRRYDNMHCFTCFLFWSDVSRHCFFVDLVLVRCEQALFFR